MTRKKSHRFYALLALVIVLPLVAYAVTYSWTWSAEQPEHMGVQIVLIVALVGALLAFPYWMVKLASRAAHIVDPKEHELTIKDVAKDQDQLNKS